MSDFKDGVTDALLYGEGMRENNRSQLYKEGYDFGITLYLQDMEDRNPT